MTNLMVSELHLLKSDLKRQYKEYQRAFWDRIHQGSLPSWQQFRHLLRRGPISLRKFRKLCRQIPQTEPDRELNGQELRQLLNIPLLDHWRSSQALSFLRAEAPFEWQIVLRISSIFGIDDIKLLFLQNAVQNRIENSDRRTSRDRQMLQLGGEFTSRGIYDVLDILQAENLLTIDNCRKIFRDLHHLELRKEVLHFFSEKQLEITQRKFDLLSEMDWKHYQNTKKILLIAQEWELEERDFLDNIMTELLQLKSTHIQHTIFCLERMGKHSFLKTEGNFYYGLSFKSPNELGNALIQLENKKILTQKNLRQYIHRKTKAMVLSPEKEIISDDYILSTLDQAHTERISSEHMGISLNSVMNSRLKTSNLIDVREQTQSLGLPKLTEDICSSRQKRMPAICMDALRVKEEGETQPSFEKIEENFHTIFEHHRLQTQLKHHNFQAIRYLSEIYTVYQLGKATASGNEENIEWTLGSIGAGLLGSAAGQQIRLFKKSTRLPLKRMARLSPLVGRGVGAFPVFFFLTQDIEQLRKQDKEALPHVLEDASFLGVESALAGAEILGIETGPVGEVISTFLMVGFDIYESVKAVKGIDQRVHLTRLEKLREGLRAFIGLSGSIYLEGLIERKEHNEAITRQQFEKIKYAPFIDTVIYSLGKTKTTETLVFNGVLETHRNRMILTTEDFFSIRNKYLYCKVVKLKHQTFDFGDNIIVFNNTKIYDCPPNIRTCPFDGRSDQFNFLCLPDSESSVTTETLMTKGYQGKGTSIAQASSDVDQQFCLRLKGSFLSRVTTRQSLGGYTLPQIERSFCYNAVILAKKETHPDHAVLVNLGKDGQKFYKGYKYKPHIFLLDGGANFIQASERDDTVIIRAPTSGRIEAFRGNNTLYLGDYAHSDQALILNLETKTLQMGNVISHVQGFTHIVGSALPDIILFPRTVSREYERTHFIDGGGGGDFIKPAPVSGFEEKTSDQTPTTITILLHSGDHMVANENIQSILIKSQGGPFQISIDPLINRDSPPSFLPIHLLERSLSDIQNMTYYPLSKSLNISLGVGDNQQHIVISGYQNRSDALFVTQENYLFYPLIPGQMDSSSDHCINILDVYVPSNISSISELRNISQLLPSHFFAITHAQRDQKPIMLGSAHHDLFLIPEGGSYFEGGEGNDAYVFFKNSNNAIINNDARDKAWDIIDISRLNFLGQLEGLYIYPDLYLSMKDKIDGREWATVKVLNFTQDPHYQHLKIMTNLREKLYIPKIPALTLPGYNHTVCFELAPEFHRLEINNLEGISDISASDIIKYNFLNIQLTRPIFQYGNFSSYYKSGDSLLVWIEDSIFQSGFLITGFYKHLFHLLTSEGFDLQLSFQNKITVTRDQLRQAAAEAYDIAVLLSRKHSQHIIKYPISCCDPITIFHLNKEPLSQLAVGLLDFNNTHYQNVSILAQEQDLDLILNIHSEEKEPAKQTITLKGWKAPHHMPIVFKWPVNANVLLLSQPILFFNNTLDNETATTLVINQNRQKRFVSSNGGSGLHSGHVLSFIPNLLKNIFYRNFYEGTATNKSTKANLAYSVNFNLLAALDLPCELFSYKKIAWGNYRFQAMSATFQYLETKLLLHTALGDYWAHILSLNPDWHHNDEIYWCQRLFGMIYQWASYPHGRIGYSGFGALLLETIMLHRSAHDFYYRHLWPMGQLLAYPINHYYRQMTNLFSFSSQPVILNETLCLNYLKALVRFLLDLWQFNYHRFSYFPSLLDYLLPNSHQKSFFMNVLWLALLVDSGSWLLGLGVWLLPQLPIVLEHLGIPVTQKIVDCLKTLSQIFIRYGLFLKVINPVQENPDRILRSHQSLALSHQRVMFGLRRREWLAHSCARINAPK